MQTKTKKRPVQPRRPPKQTSYECPGCHEMVDNRDPVAVHLHHDHVLHPSFYFFGKVRI